MMFVACPALLTSCLSTFVCRHLQVRVKALRGDEPEGGRLVRLHAILDSTGGLTHGLFGWLLCFVFH